MPADYLNSATKSLEQQLRLKRGVSVRTLSGATTYDARTANVCAWDPGGASRNVTMPAEEVSNGLVVWFKNTADAAENLVIKDDAGSTIVTIGQGEFAMVSCTGSAWTSTKSTVAAYADNTALNIGDGNDITLTWDGTRLNVAQTLANSEIRWGVDGAGIDQRWYGDTASAYALWDQSADTLVFGGVAGVQGAVVKTNGATAITTTRAVTRADSGGIFTVAQSSAYTITVAQPTAAGERYIFQCVSPGAFDVSLVATGCTFEGTITIDASTIPATGSTLKFATGAAVLGDSIELISTSTTKFFVRAISSGAGGITIT